MRTRPGSRSKYGPDTPGGGAAAAPSGPPSGGPGGSTPGREDRPRGTDLLLRELATGQEINIGNVSEFAFDKKGRYLAWTIDAQDKAGNGALLRDMESGAIRSIESDNKAGYWRLSWTEEGDGLAVLKAVDDKAYEDKLDSVVAFKDFRASGPYQGHWLPKDQIAATLPLVKLFNPGIFIPTHHDETFAGIFLDRATYPLFMVMREEMPATRTISTMYRTPVCINTETKAVFVNGSGSM